MTNDQLKKYYEMYTDGWKLFKEFSQPDGTDEFWLALRNKAVELEKKHQSSEIMRSIAVTTINNINLLYQNKEYEVK